MKSLRTLGASVVAVLAAGSGLLLAQIEINTLSNFNTGFEAGEGYAPGLLLDDPVWTISGSSQPEVGSFFNSGIYGLILDNGDTISVDFTSLESPSVGWVDLYLKPTFERPEVLPLEFPLGQAALTGFVKVDLAGEVYVLHGDGMGNGEWIGTGYSVVLNGSDALNWLRMTYRLDYNTQNWDLYLDDTLQMIDIGFVDESAPPLSSFLLKGGEAGSTHFDDFSAGFINPLFTDEDNDGIDDAYEAAQGMDVSTNDREGDLDFDNIVNVLEFMNGLEAGNPDTDGDGVNDGAELLDEADPTSPDVYDLESVPYLEGFEAFSEGDLTAQSFWQVSGGSAVVQSIESIEGEKALELQVGETTLELENSFDGSDFSKVWVDFKIRPVLFKEQWLDDINDYVSPNAAAAFFFIENDKIAILDGNGIGGWTILEHLPIGPEGWTRVTVRKDYIAQSFELWLDGTYLGGPYDFANQQPYFNYISIKQENSASTFLDDVYVSHQRPTGLDTDGDGLFDDEEDTNGNEIVDPGETDPLLVDTDADGFLDGDPVNMRLWLRADQGVLIDDNNQLTSWLDQSIYKDHALPEDSDVSPSFIGGRVQFDGVDDFLAGPSSFNANDGDFTIIIVQQNTGNSDAAVLSYDNSELALGSPLLTWSDSSNFGIKGPGEDRGLFHDLSEDSSVLALTSLRRSGGQANGLNSELKLHTASDVHFIDSTGVQDWESAVYNYRDDLVAITLSGPNLNSGHIDGSVQVCLADSFNFNGASINGDLFVAGGPEVIVNGSPNWEGVVEGNGEPSANYRVTLNSSASFGSLKTFTDTVQLPELEAVSSPQGHRYVSLNDYYNDPGDFATIQNLTLNGNNSAVNVPSGSYGNFTVNGNNSIILGDPNAEEPLVYEFQRLTLNGNSALKVLGPVLIRVKNSIFLNSQIGEVSTVDLLTLELPTANLTLNGNSQLFGKVYAPSGRVTLNGTSSLTGRLISEELTLNGGNIVSDGSWPINPSPELGYLIGKASRAEQVTLAGDVLEIRVYDHALDDAVLSLIHSQLSQKYGIDEDFDDDGIVNYIDDDLDGDGLLNVEEDLNGNGIVDAGESSPFNNDSDGDGLLDTYEPLWLADPITDAAALEVQPDGSLMTRFSFDAADGYQSGSLGGQQGWEAAPIFRISDDDAAANSDQSLTIGQVAFNRRTYSDDNNFATARHYLNASDESIIWVSFHAKLQPAVLTQIDFSSAPAVALALSSEDTVAVYDSALGDWREAPGAVSPNAWVRYDLELDYTNKVWKLCIEGESLMTDIPFVDPDRSSLEHFTLLQHSGSGSDSWIDEIEISNVEPAGLDFDGDGLENATERQLGSNLNVADTDGDGLDDLYEYTNGLDLLAYDIGEVDGVVRRDVWTNITGESLSVLTDSSNYPTNPDLQSLRLDLDIQDDESMGDHYGQRIYGLIVAPETAEYVFSIAGDDYGAFWISSDSSAFHKSRLCYFDRSTAYQDWSRFPTQRSKSVQLEAGQAYYFEILHKENEGLSHVAVAWEYGSTPLHLITSEHLRTHTPDLGDADQDGLPDDWEVANNLDPTVGYGANGSHGDPNLDGRFNAQHYQLDTDPLNPDSDEDGLSNETEVNLLKSDPFTDDAGGYDALSEFAISSINGGLEGVAYKDISEPRYYFSASGTGVSEVSDSGHYLHKPVTGDFSFTILLENAEGGLTPEVSLMLRDSLAPTSDMGALLRESNLRHMPHYGRSSQSDDFKAGELIYQFSSNETWMRLDRIGETLYSYCSQDGITWRLVSASNAPSAVTAELGVFASSGSAEENTYVTFSIEALLIDTDQDGIWNADELAYGTSATEWDSDGDGFSDFEEIYDFYSDPTVADLESAAVVSTVDGSATVSTLGDWVSDGGVTYAIGGRGAVEYDLNVPEAAIYRLNVLGQSRFNTTGYDDYSIKVEIDGVYIGRINMNKTLESEEGYGRIMTPWLPEGQHRVRLFVDNTSEHRSLQLNSVMLEFVGGDDLDIDGTPDWMQARLDINNGLHDIDTGVVIESQVSPSCLIGRSRYLSLSETTNMTQQLEPLPNFEFFLDVELSSHSDTPVELSFENNSISEIAVIRWVATDVITSETITIRKGDSLLLTAFDEYDSSNQQITVSINTGNPIISTEDDAVEQIFETAGEHVVIATVGNLSGILTVQVLEAELGGDNYELLVNSPRTFTPVALSNEAELSFDEWIHFSEVGISNEIRNFELTALDVEPTYVAARLPQNGTVLDALEIKPFYLASTSDSHLTILENYEDGDILVPTDIVLDHIPDNLEVTVSIFVAGVTFADGSISKTLTANDFDDLGRTTVYFIKPASGIGSVCHRISVNYGVPDTGVSN